MILPGGGSLSRVVGEGREGVFQSPCLPGRRTTVPASRQPSRRIREGKVRRSRTPGTAGILPALSGPPPAGSLTIDVSTYQPGVGPVRPGSALSTGGRAMRPVPFSGRGDWGGRLSDTAQSDKRPPSTRPFFAEAPPPSLWSGRFYDDSGAPSESAVFAHRSTVLTSISERRNMGGNSGSAGR